MISKNELESSQGAYNLSLGILLLARGNLELANAGRDWGKEEKGTTEDEMAGWHHQLDGHEFE